MTALSRQTVVLASTSPTRRTMLENAGVNVVAVAPRVDEDEIKASMTAEGASGEALAEVLAERKALYVSRQRPQDLVIGADQILDCDGVIYSKPADLAAAKDQLLALKGKTHKLISCVCVVRGEQRLWHHLDHALLAMRDFSTLFLDAYLDAVGQTALDGPGSYRIEGYGAQLFSRVTGDHFTILGLPLLPLLDYLRIQGVLTS